ncbi:hypothetical protein M0Q50_08025 [bacterium]|jgi:hypothetical protein|nr:hypothetical protein [bacterium]
MKNQIQHTVDLTDEMIDEAVSIIKDNVDPDWDEKTFGCMYIGVTGKHQVYYTLWKFSPRVSNYINPVIYLCNLSTDIVKAAQKAKKHAGNQPIYFEEYETLKGMQGAPADVLSFGKYRGISIGEIYSKDPQYIIWLSKNMQPHNKKENEILYLANELTDDYFRSMTEKNLASETKQYLEVNTIFNGLVKITNVGLLDESFRFNIKAETSDYRLVFKLSCKTVCDAYGIEYKGNLKHNQYAKLTMFPNFETIANVKKIIENISEIKIVGKVKYNNEKVGKKWNWLSNVKIIK